LEPWFVYVARCADGTLYVGVARDVAARIARHDAGKGARYTRGRGPLRVLATRRCATRGDALRLEWALKQLPREDKLAMAGSPRKLAALARTCVSALVALALASAAPAARAQVVAAEPAAPVEAPFPEGAPPLEVQVVLQLVVDAGGAVESAIATSRTPADAPEAFDAAAVAAVKATRFAPSTRDGRPIRSRVEYVVVFHPPRPPAPAPPAPPPGAEPGAAQPLSTTEPDEDYAQVVQVRGAGWSSPRGLGDVRVKRELLEASPRQQTSEMLSAAPGFFVDHEDGEGLGNDVYLRGFDVEHGSGVEMRVGSIPLNVPLHIQGQGYADANFLLPEVVRSIRVLEGPYDPRQGDAAIVGSAYFDLGVADRGYRLSSSYGSFHQYRVAGVAAPAEADEETFAAFAVRETDGFGQNRAGRSASLNAQYGFDLGARDHVRLLATAYGSRFSLAGVVRQDDVDSGRIAYDGSYPLAGGQGVQSSRVILGADLDHVTAAGARFEFAPWMMWTDFVARQNFTGNLESSRIDPSVAGLGDLFESTNVETAVGLTARFHTAPVHLGETVEVVGEPGVTFRAGHTDQSRSLLVPDTLLVWDRRIDAALETLDAGAYLDLDVRLLKRLRISGGPRVDLLAVSVDDRLAGAGASSSAPAGILPGARTDVAGVAVGPRVTVAYEATPVIVPVVSYGQGFRSLDAASLTEGARPYSLVRSVEGGVRLQADRERLVTTVSAFSTWVENELVFEAADGGFETEQASVRRGLVGSVIARPFDWLLASGALSVTSATFSTLVAGVGHYVPSIPPVLFRADVTARGVLARLRCGPLSGRVGAGYTLLSGRHLTDTVVGATSHVLNAGAAARCGPVELGVDAFNVLGLQYPDDEAVYVSNWSASSPAGTTAQPPASVARHITAAPPRSAIATLSLYF
jgi:TonB family protein